MSDKSTYLRAFNTHFFEFIDDIVSIIDENDEIVYAKTSFDTIRRANPTAILKVWFNFVHTPYKYVIEQGDISFFFEKDYKADLAHLANASEIMNIIDTIRIPIKNMSDVNRSHSVKYIQNLSKLSTLYMQ